MNVYVIMCDKVKPHGGCYGLIAAIFDIKKAALQECADMNVHARRANDLDRLYYWVIEVTLNTGYSSVLQESLDNEDAVTQL